MSLLLLDTHIVLWAAGQPEKLSTQARALLENPENELAFSAASLWEIAIKNTQNRADFRVDGHALRRGLLRNGYREISVTGEHAVAVQGLPMLHKDPFDRILIAQAEREGALLVTCDGHITRYPFPFIRPV